MPEANRNDIMEAEKHTTTQSNSNAKREQKRVQFFPRVKFRRLGLWKTEGEVRKSWYSTEELENARKSEKSLRDYFSLTNNLTPTSTENLLILGFRTEEERKRKEAIEVAFDKVLVNELMSRNIECEAESLISRLRSFHDERSKGKGRVRRSKRRKIENSSDSETVSLSEGEKSMADFRVSQFSKSQLSRMTARQARFEILFLEMLKEERKEIPLLEENHDPSDNQWCTVS